MFHHKEMNTQQAHKAGSSGTGLMENEYCRMVQLVNVTRADEAKVEDSLKDLVWHRLPEHGPAIVFPFQGEKPSTERVGAQSN